MVDSRQKGARAETALKKVLRDATGLNFQRTPGSGALNETHKLKGDIYIPNEKNKFCIEVKHYKDDHLTSKLLTSKNPQLFQWWEQAITQAEKVDMEPMLFFKFDRSKWFTMVKLNTVRNDYDSKMYPGIKLFLYYRGFYCCICTIETLLQFEGLEWTL